PQRPSWRGRAWRARRGATGRCGASPRHRATWGPGPCCPRSAATTSPADVAWSTWTERVRRCWSTAAPAAWRTWLPSGRSQAAIAAFDGDPTTMWAADRYLRPRKRWIQIGFDRPRRVPYVDLLPIRDWRGIEKQVSVNGVKAKLGPGVTRVRLGLKNVRSLR